MIGGEHRKERYSERLSEAQNQPKNRGYLPGTAAKSAGYTSVTLAGNWYEERADAAYADGKAVLPTADATRWTTTYREMVKPAAGGASAAQPVFDQPTMIVVVDRTESAYPAHQPHLDPQREELAQTAMTTVSQSTYRPPAESQTAAEAEPLFVPPVLGGTPGAQAKGVLRRFRHQLKLSMPNRSAFPGNVMRCTRQALRRAMAASAKGGARPQVNVPELQAGLAEVGIAASVPECTAVVHFFDRTGCGAADVAELTDELRGAMTDRRAQLVRSAYALLTTIAAADAASGRGEGLVRLPRLVELVDVRYLPDVVSGATTAEEAKAAFEEQWEEDDDDSHGPGAPSAMRNFAASVSGHADRVVNAAAFADFFSDASFEVATEGDFETLLRNMWHLSGGSGNCTNQSCRRVEVVHTNGRVTKEEVKNDLAILGGDSDEVNKLITANLEKQGIKDIKSFRVLSGGATV